MSALPTKRTSALLFLAGTLLLAAITLNAGTAQGQATPGVDFGDPIIDAEGTLVAGEPFTTGIAVDEGLFYVVEFIPPGPTNTLTLSGAAFYTLLNGDGVEQLNERDQNDAPLRWRATFTGTATLRVRGAQASVAGTFGYRVFRLADDHSDERTAGTAITIGDVVDGHLIFSFDGVRDLDWFGFVGQEGAEYNVILTAADTDNTLTLPRGRIDVLRGAALTPLVEGNHTRPVNFVAPASGQYYVLIDGPQTSVEGTYQLQVVQIGGSPVRITPNPGGYASGVTGVVVEVLSDGSVPAQTVADAIAEDSGRTVQRLWLFTTNQGWLLWSAGPIDFGLSEFSGISAAFAVLS